MTPFFFSFSYFLERQRKEKEREKTLQLSPRRPCDRRPCVSVSGPHKGKGSEPGSGGHVLIPTFSLRTIQTSYSVIFVYYPFSLL